jgi:hypothetical protein
VPGVYTIQPVPTDGGLRGEMSDQVNVNNVDQNNRAFHGYPAWLTDVNLSPDYSVRREKACIFSG